MFFSKPKEEEVSGQLEIDLIMSMVKAVQKVVLQKFEENFKEKPKIEKKMVVQWQGKMKITRPADCVYTSVILIERPKAKDNGIIILYIPEMIAESVALACGAMRSEGMEGLLRGCGVFLSDVASMFQSYMNKLGYEELKFSQTTNFASNPNQLFDYYQSTKFQITFIKDDEKFVEFDVGIGPIKKTATPAGPQATVL